MDPPTIPPNVKPNNGRAKLTKLPKVLASTTELPPSASMSGNVWVLPHRGHFGKINGINAGRNVNPQLMHRCAIIAEKIY
ncbi:MAG: hypothetical protein IPQ18_14480 [Saprospiraceae bacterium]|nr:hypothetical protein [Saprospiraceae bacterium]